MRFFRMALLPAIVFVTGACVLIVEVVATRVLSPYYGNTIFTVSSVISVVLAGLSVGYYAGGRLVDRRPSFEWFFSLIFASGAALLLLHWVGMSVLPTFSLYFSISTGPLATSLALFFIPALLMGTLSPFAVALQKDMQPEQGIGSVAGTIFFWSTLGSIAGSLLAGFVLVPRFGVSNIIILVSALLSALGALGLAQRRKVLAILLLSAALGAAALLARAGDAEGKTLYSKDGVYEKIAIYDGEIAGKPARFFMQDRSLSGAMYLESDELVYDYTKYYVLYKLFTPEMRRALVIGGGAYSIPRALLKDAPQARVDVAEIEPSLYDLAKEYFGVADSPRLHNYTEDGRRFLQEATEPYDLIFSDVYYSLFSIPAHFTTREFFETAKSKLSPDGILVLNVIGSLSAEEPSFLLSELRTMRGIFPEVLVFAEFLDSPAPQNVILVGLNRERETPDFSRSDNPFLRGLAARLVPFERYQLSKYPLLTDDYAPVEYLVGNMLTKEYRAIFDLPDFSVWSADRALKDIETQVSFGSRARGTDGHARTEGFIKDELGKTSADVETQEGSTHVSSVGYPITNILGRFQPENPRRLILATHYDALARAYADREHPNAVMPGANNGASGVALLLEAARSLDSLPPLPYGVDIVFFDGEEGVGSLGAGETEPWIPLGSTYFAGNLADVYPDAPPESALVFDMVCDADLNLYPEAQSRSSAPEEVERFWAIGSTIAPRAFVHEGPARAIGDDHTPLIKAGIPSLLIIDFDYSPWFNTTNDTPDKCSKESMEAVGKTLLQYLYTLR